MKIGKLLFGPLYDTWKGFKRQRAFETNFFGNRVGMIDAIYSDSKLLSKKFNLVNFKTNIDANKPKLVIRPMQLKMENSGEVNQLIKELIKSRKQQNLETEDFESGIQLLIKHGLFYDELYQALSIFQNGGIHLFETNTFIAELINCSHVTIDLEKVEGDNTYTESDLELFFKDYLQLKLSMIGLGGIILTCKTIKKEEEVVYHITITAGNITKSYTSHSDFDAYEPMYSLLNQIEPLFAVLNNLMIELGCTKRFYNLEGFKSLLDVSLVPVLMKRYHILIFAPIEPQEISELVQEEVTEKEIREVTNFDEDGEPEIEYYNNGTIIIRFNFMPPLNGNDEQSNLPIFEQFDKELERITGKQVEWDDREFFIIADGDRETALVIKEYLENFWQEVK